MREVICSTPPFWTILKFLRRCLRVPLQQIIFQVRPGPYEFICLCHATMIRSKGIWKKFGSEYPTSLLRYHDFFHTLSIRGYTPVLFITSAAASISASVSAIQVHPSVLDAYPRYSVTNINTWHDGLTADLVLLPNPCKVFGDDILKLS